MVRTFLAPTVAKPIIAASHFMTWASSAIVVGITGYFLKNFAHGTHLIYEIVIAALTLAFWIPLIVLPLMKSYRHYAIPLNWIFSYLYATKFFFSYLNMFTNILQLAHFLHLRSTRLQLRRRLR